MATMNATAFASPVADASSYVSAFVENPYVDNVIQTLSGMSVWQIALTLFLGLVVYDQGTSCRFRVGARESWENVGLT